jgi:MFS family permease
VATSFATIFISAGIGVWSLGIFAPFMEDDLGWDRSSIFMPMTIRFIIAALATPIIARFLDRRHGATIILASGAILHSIATALCSTVTSEWEFMLYFGVIGGIATTGQAIVVASAIIPKWFVKGRGQALATANMSGGLGAFVLPLLLTSFIIGIGWRETWIILAVANLLITIPLSPLMNRQPEDYGLLPDGIKSEDGNGTTSTSEWANEKSYTLNQVVRTKTFWILVAGVMLATFPILGLPVNLVTMFRDGGASPATAAAAFTVYGVFSALARFAWSYLAQRTTPRVALMVLSIYGAPVILLYILFLGNIPSMFILSGLAGFAMGGVLVLNPLIWPAYFGRAHIGAISGISFPLTSVSAAVGPTIMSIIFDRTDSYLPGLILLATAWSLTSFVLYFAGPSSKLRIPQPVVHPQT